MRLKRPSRVLMTVDAVGGIWHYALNLSRALDRAGIACLLVGFGPPGNALHETLGLDRGRLVWTDAPLDWMADDATALHHTSATITSLADEWGAELLHINVPSQAAALASTLPVVVASHSCVPTWWHAVHGCGLPQALRWHQRVNAEGFARADAVVVPSQSHAAALTSAYGPIAKVRAVYNATALPEWTARKEEFILAAGRWWDEAKNGSVLDRAAADSAWPVMMTGATTGPTGGNEPISHARALGELPRAELQRLMSRAAIFAAPSLYEPFGLAVLEAAASGAALVLTDIPTFRELWDDAAIFVSPRDAGAFAAAFSALSTSPGQLKQLAHRARARAAQFTQERQTAAMLEVYGAAMTRAVASVQQVA